MSFSRRDFLAATGLGAALGTLASMKGCKRQPVPDAVAHAAEGAQEESSSWLDVKGEFNLNPDLIHMAGPLIASHPRSVRDAIERYRRSLDENPGGFLPENYSTFEGELRFVAADYLGARPIDIALTDSTTMGIALMINGLEIRENQEMLTTDFDYYSTHHALDYKSRRTGAQVRKIPLYQDIFKVSEDELVGTLVDAVKPETRLVTATWVHSSTGLKVPIKALADEIKEINKNRNAADRLLLFVDGVHGFGVESETVASLGCDFFAAGTHKWIFGPRGTGLLWGNPETQDNVTPTIPTFSRTGAWGGSMTPGGFKAFEHQWAVADAFRFHKRLGPENVTRHIHGLCTVLKEGLARMSHVTLYTPQSESLSAGIVCFDVRGMTPQRVVERLRRNNIISSTTPYTPSHARLTPGIFNTVEDIEAVLRAMRSLA